MIGVKTDVRIYVSTGDAHHGMMQFLERHEDVAITDRSRGLVYLPGTTGFETYFKTAAGAFPWLQGRRLHSYWLDPRIHPDLAALLDEECAARVTLSGGRQARKRARGR